MTDRLELPATWRRSTRHSSIPSGGRGTIRLGDRTRQSDGIAVLDCVREVRPPFSPDAVTAEIRDVLLGLWRERGPRRSVRGRVAAREVPRAWGHIRPAERTSRTLYQAFLPLLSAGRCELLDNPRLIGSSCSWSGARRVAGATRSTMRRARTTTSRTQRPVRSLLSARSGAACGRARRLDLRCGQRVETVVLGAHGSSASPAPTASRGSGTGVRTRTANGSASSCQRNSRWSNGRASGRRGEKRGMPHARRRAATTPAVTIH